MSDLRERVLHLLKLRELSQAEAGRRSGFKNAAFINDIIRGHKTDVGSKGLGALAIGLQTTEDYLLGKSDDPEIKVRHSLIASYDPEAPDPLDRGADQGEGVDARKVWGPEAIPELLAQGGLGSGQVIASIHAGELHTVDQVKGDYWRIPNEFARGVLGAAPIHLVVVECSGDSMAPTLQSGDRVWVNTLHRLPTPDGLYALRDVFDQVVVKRIEIAQDVPLRLRIISDNPAHNAREVGHDEVNIIGKVVAGLKLF